MAALALRLSSLDALRVARGHCLSCDWCPRFLSPSKRILCDYCGCPPAKHHRIEGNDNAAKKRGGGKKMRLAAAVAASSSGTPSSEDEGEDDLDEGTDSETEDEEIHPTRRAAVRTRGDASKRKKRLQAAATVEQDDKEDIG